MSDDIIADILRADTEDGAPVVNIGEQTTGLGFGADTSVWGNGDGFISIPNNPSDAGAAQAIVTQDGHVKRATQTRDQRWVTKAGVLEIGDKAIVSDSEAWFRLTRASDKIEIVSGTRSITIDGDGDKIELRLGSMRITMTATVISINNGPDTLANPSHISITPTGITIGPAAGVPIPVLIGASVGVAIPSTILRASA